MLFIFDIDGVLTNPTTKKVDNNELFAKLNQLSKTMPILLNTGRSAQWVIDKILPHLNINQSTSNFYAACEMGAVLLTIDNNGKPNININKDVSSQKIPKELYDTITDMVAQNYDASMFVDTTKQVIMTVEMQDNYPIDKYEIDKEELKNSIEIILKHYHPNLHIRPSSSTIAIDIKPVQLTKGYGAKMIHSWLIDLKIDLTKTEIVCFGDSKSDIEMCEYFASKKIITKFVYVGTEQLVLSKDYEIIKPNNSHTIGTHEYLTKLSTTTTNP